MPYKVLSNLFLLLSLPVPWSERGSPWSFLEMFEVPVKAETGDCRGTGPRLPRGLGLAS